MNKCTTPPQSLDDLWMPTRVALAYLEERVCRYRRHDAKDALPSIGTGRERDATAIRSSLGYNTFST